MTWTQFPLLPPNQPVRAAHLQAIWDNAQSLGLPSSALNRSQALVSSNYSLNTTSTWQDVSGSEMRVTLDTTPEVLGTFTNSRDVLVTANALSYIGFSGPIGGVRVVLKSNGGPDVVVSQYRIAWSGQAVSLPIWLVLTGLTSGEHLIRLQHALISTPGGGGVLTAVFSAHWFYAQEV